MKLCKHENCSNPATFGRQCQPCRNYMYRYGMNQPQIVGMLDNQHGLCNLCHKAITIGRYNGIVDHCHDSGKVRSILCHDCNVMVGYLENSKINLDRLKSYLS